MPSPAPNLYPPFNIVRLSHVEYVVRDIAVSRDFYVDTLGLQVTHAEKGRLYLRAMEERGHHCIALIEGAEPAANVLGFKLYDEPDLEKAGGAFPRPWPARRLDRAPVPGPDHPHDRSLGDPAGVLRQDGPARSIHQQYKLYRGVKALRIDHFNMFASDVDASVKFYNDIGFRVTEYTEDEETGRLWAAWMHRKGGVHDVPSPTGWVRACTTLRSGCRRR